MGDGRHDDTTTGGAVEAEYLQRSCPWQAVKSITTWTTTCARQTTRHSLRAEESDGTALTYGSWVTGTSDRM